MQDQDDSGAPDTSRAAQAAGLRLSRRSMLKGAAGVGAAGIAASAFAGMAVPAAAASAQARSARGPAEERAERKSGEAVVVHVRDAAAGEIDVYRGANHARLHDRDLAARLVRASR